MEWAELQRARADYDLGEHDRAEIAVRRLLARIRGRSADAALRGAAHTLLGRIEAARGEEDEARRAFRQAVSCFDQGVPDALEPAGRVYSDYGRALYMLGERDEEAQENLERALRLGYSHASTYRYLGYTQLRRGLAQAAEENLRRALELAPGNAQALRALADCLAAQQRSEEAAAVLQDLVWLLVSGNQLDAALEAATGALDLNPSAMSEAVIGSVLRLAERDEDGVERLRAALEKDPRIAWIHTELGEALRDLGRLDEALAALDQALEIEPDDAFALARRGDTLKLLGRFDEALESLDRALEAQPDDVFALVRKSETLAALGRFEPARTILDQGLDLQPDSVSMLVSKAQILWAEDRGDDALETLDRALDLDPGSAPALATRAEILRASGRAGEALELYRRALESDPGVPWIYSGLGATLSQLGRPSEALWALDQALELQPADVFVLGVRGEVLGELDRHEEALAAFDEILDLQPGEPFALAHRGEALRLLGRLDEALEALDQSLELRPEDPFALARRGETLRMLGRFDEALATVHRGLQLDPDDAMMLATKGEILRVEGRDEDALEALDRAIELEPDHAFALATKAQVLRGRGEVEAAMELLQLVLEGAEDDPNLAWVHGEQGMALWQLGELEKALEAFENALDLYPDNAYLLVLRADLLQTLDSFDDALESVDEALALEPDNALALATKGGLLVDFAEYWEGYQLLERATEFDPDNPWAYGLKAFALQYMEPELEPERLEKGEAASRAAVHLDRETLRFRVDLGDFLKLQGRSREASEEYGWVIRQGELASVEMDADDLAMVAWSHYRLGDHDAAVQQLAAATRSAPGLTSVQFDLALALMCSGRYGLGRQQYQRGLEMMGERHRLRQRGLCHVALADLREAVRDYPELSRGEELRQTLQQLEKTLAKVTAAARPRRREEAAVAT